MTYTKEHGRVLFFSANAGTGHNVAARVLCDALNELNPTVECKIFNSYELLNQPLGKVLEEGYIHLLRLLPRIYGYFYDRKNKKRSITGIKNWLNNICASNFNKVIRKEDPDVIVCTHAFPCGVFSSLKRQYGMKQKVLGVVTDYVVSPFWIYPETDAYMIASQDLMGTFNRRGFIDEKVIVTGIPVDPRFNGKGLEKTEARKQLGLAPDKPTVLIMGGGWGMNPATGSLHILNKIKREIQAIVIMGQNEREQNKMSEALKHFENGRVKVHVRGYVDNVYEYMKASDLLVTKPGGLTSAEAIVSGLPMIITSPIPGQETRNVRYLIKRGAAVPVFDEEKLPQVIEKLITDEKSLNDLAKKASRLAIPNSAQRAAKFIHSCMPGNGSV